jgi:hypothetical protein
MNALLVVLAKVNVPLRQSARERRNMSLIPSFVLTAGPALISVLWKLSYREKRNRIILSN